MKHPQFECLGDDYPYHLEDQFDRVLTKIDQLWDTEQIEDYFCDLIIDRRGGHGFPKDVMDDILKLRNLRESETLRRAECRDDTIHLLESRGNSLNKDQFFKALHDGNKEIIDLFVRSNFNIHIEDSQGTPAILIAMKKGYSVIASILLNAGADINSSDKMGITPLSGHFVL